MQTTEMAAQALAAPSIIANATVVVWVVGITFMVDDVEQHVFVVERSPLAARPDALELIPDEAEFLRADSLPAEHLREMPLEQRYEYRKHFTAYRMWCRAQDLGMTVEGMKPHEHYDPIQLSEDLLRWLRPFNRYAD